MWTSFISLVNVMVKILRCFLTWMPHKAEPGEVLVAGTWYGR
jgi:hypothetical protein